MMNRSTQKISFKGQEENLFEKQVLNRVNAYFTQNNLSKKATPVIWVKAGVFFTLSTISYLAIYLVPPTWAWITLAFVCNSFFSLAFVLNLGHDGMHGAISKNPRINDLTGLSWNLVGMSSYIWKLRHNYAHHSFTNVPGIDHDIIQSGLFRFNPTLPRKKFHRFQHIYGLFIFGLTSINLVFVKDFQLYQLHKFGNKEITHPKYQLLKIIALKIFYLTYALALPLIFSEAAPWMIFLGFFIGHYVTGWFAAAVFLPNHLHPSTHFSEPNDQGVIGKSWLSHQLEITFDYSANNPLVSWLTGGLNLHVAHHMFPNISHVHYGVITNIITEEAQRHGLPYSNVSWGKAVRNSLQYLKIVGQKDAHPELMQVTA